MTTRNKKQGLTLTLWAVVVCAVLGLALPAPGGIIVPPGLNPGDSYHLIFVTSTSRDATSGDINDYHAFVNAAADTSPLSGVPDVNWYAIASTTGGAVAKDLFSDTAPRYEIDGSPLVAADYAAMWGTMDPWVDVDLGKFTLSEQGVAVADDTKVYTGTNTDGTPHTWKLGSGSEHTRVGFVGRTNHNWIDCTGSGDPSTNEHRLYAISEKLTVLPASVPGDLDGDGDVDLADLGLFELQFGSQSHGPAPGPPYSADFDEDQDVDLDDFVVMRDNLGAGVTAPQPAGAATPEPATLILMAAGLPVLVRRSRRRRRLLLKLRRRRG